MPRTSTEESEPRVKQQEKRSIQLSDMCPEYQECGSFMEKNDDEPAKQLDLVLIDEKDLTTEKKVLLCLSKRETKTDSIHLKCRGKRPGLHQL
ncbi:hypothetical protein U9M48_011859 [Paspalum notatum var. saurae]|uniref:Uncharacterized protein n=2 Tax=Paspalum notatum var. saurae TaxID=547442 RepID=A0AAQ3SWR7_PASNO